VRFPRATRRSTVVPVVVVTRAPGRLMFRQVVGHDLPTPFVDAMLPDGSRLHVVIPQITRRHMAVNIRKFVLGLH
jgi:hypothetical protein